MELLAALRPKHLRVDLDLASKDWPEEWCRASKVADRLAAKLHAALFLTEDPGVRTLGVSRRGAARTRVTACLVFDKAEKSTCQRRSYALARRILDGMPVVAGTNDNFTELNRRAAAARGPDGLLFQPAGARIR